MANGMAGKDGASRYFHRAGTTSGVEDEITIDFMLLSRDLRNVLRDAPFTARTPRPYGIRTNTHSRPLTTHAELTSRTIFSGIQPTGVPHLGNYLGALRQWVTLQNDSPPSTTLLYSLVDLHAITTRQPPAQLRQWKKESLATLLAIGLDPARSTLFHQSAVPAHAELLWILSCHASTGYLSRMTQWKDKTTGKANAEKLKLGLFSYPVLQAADVLLHATTHVPVGHDQAQHLEFARELANGFNAAYDTDVLVPPETLLSPAKRIMSLTEPTAKMSKSAANPKSRILLTDPDDVIARKLASALTDAEYTFSYSPSTRPGVSNLLEILFHLDPEATELSVEAYAREMEGTTMPAFKGRVVQRVQGALGPIRERFAAIMGDEGALERVAAEGAENAGLNAAATMGRVREAVGLR